MSKLEDLFFHSQNVELTKQLQSLKKMEETMDSLRSVSGIHDEAVLRKLIELNIRPETLASLSIVPCIFMAWADGKVESNENKAILAAVGKLGWNPTGVDYALMEQWMKSKPPQTLFDAWVHYVEGTCKKLTKIEKTRFKQELIAPAKLVGKSSGGFLGFGKLSAQEKDMLGKIEEAFGICHE